VRAVFQFEPFKISASVSPKTRHLITTMEFSGFHDVDGADEQEAKLNKWQVPSPDIFPSRMYTEIIATTYIEVEDEIALQFENFDQKARDFVLDKAEEVEDIISGHIDYAAGIFGLSFGAELVSTVITEQIFAYRSLSEKYAYRLSNNITVVQGLTVKTVDFEKNIKAVHTANIKFEMTTRVFAWLLRGWESENRILRFISFFTALEMIIPADSNPEIERWQKTKTDMQKFLKKNAPDHLKEEFAEFFDNSKYQGRSLKNRFDTLAKTTNPGHWEVDSSNFQLFNRIRNEILHSGKPGATHQVNLRLKDIEKLELLTVRYVKQVLCNQS